MSDQEIKEHDKTDEPANPRDPRPCDLLPDEGPDRRCWRDTPRAAGPDGRERRRAGWWGLRPVVQGSFHRARYRVPDGPAPGSGAIGQYDRLAPRRCEGRFGIRGPGCLLARGRRRKPLPGQVIGVRPRPIREEPKVKGRSAHLARRTGAGPLAAPLAGDRGALGCRDLWSHRGCQLHSFKEASGKGGVGLEVERLDSLLLGLGIRHQGFRYDRRPPTEDGSAPRSGRLPSGSSAP
jgi:hypothetical protein